MANNIDVTPGTGKTVATEEIASTQYQQIKLIDATAASTTPTGVAANPLQVSLANTSANATAVKVDGSAVTQPVSGSVSLSAVVPGTGATNLGKAEDAAHSSGDVGVFALAVQKASPADLAADGDYAALEVSGGRLWVDPSGVTLTVASHAVTNAGTFAVQVTADVPGTGATNLGKAEDAVHSSGDTGVMSLAVRNDAGTALAADGDYIPLQVNSAGALYVTGGGGGTQYTEAAAAAADPVGTAMNLVSVATPGNEVTAGQNVAARGTIKGELYVKQTDAVPVTDNAGSLTVDNAGTFAVQATVAAGATTIGKAEDVAASGGDVGVPAMAIQTATPANTAAEGDYVMHQMSAGRLWVDASGTTLTVASHAVTNAGTFAVQESGTQVQVDDAAFTPATSKIVMAGFEADESSTDSVDEGDGGAARITLDRKQIVAAYPHTAGGCLIANMTSGDTFTALTSTAQAIKASAGQLYGWYIYNPNATATYVNIYNVASGSVTVGTTTPAMNIVIPATSAANILGAVGIEFTNAGFSASATTTGGGNTAPATALEANFFYK